MKGIVEIFINRNRATLLLLIIIFILGIYSYVQMPRETNPDIQIPIINVSVNLQGISSEDSERLLAIPMENELKSIQGIEEISSVAIDDRAYVTLKFKAGFDSKKALEDVRAKMDDIRSKLPNEVDHLAAHEVNLSLSPIINVGLIGDLPERTLNEIARNLKNVIETLPSVLSVEAAGMRKEIVEVIIKPSVFNSYNLQLDEILSAISRNNRLIGAGVLEGDTGRYSIKISGTFKDVKDILKVPLRVQGDAVVTVEDVAKVYYKFEDRKGFTRINGKPCIVLEVSKRTGANVIETINQIKSLIDKMELPENLSVVYAQDQSDKIINIIDDLENSIIFSVLLILVVMMLTMGTRISMLVSLAIPGSFLLGIIILHSMGITLNIVVLFSLIMAVGMLVDDSIVVNEYADRKMIGGLSPSEAFRVAASDMFWPVTSATLTKLAVFIPLLFWPGVTGEFMKYIPITLVATLSSSLVIALIFTPTLGAIFGKPSTTLPEEIEKMNAIESGSLEKTSPFLKAYASVLSKVLNNPKRFILITIITLISASIIYFKFGPGVEFFPSIEPDNAIINVRAKGNLSVKERDLILREVEDHILNMKDEIKIFYARSGLLTLAGNDEPDDLIAKIQLEFANWRLRRKAYDIMDDIRNRVKNIKGVIVEVQEEKMGPQGDKPIQINLSSKSWAKVEAALNKILTLMNSSPGFINIQDSCASPEIEWDVDIDRSQAMLYGTDITVVGEFVKMITSGVIIGKYRPNNLDEEIDIIARFPKENRNLKTLDNLFVSTKDGPSPISTFTKRSPKNKINRINRVDGMRTLTVSADIASGYLASEQIKSIKNSLQRDWDKEVKIDFKGETKDQNEVQTFLLKAFILAIVLMVLVLVTEFNSVYNTFIVMTAVFLSTTCVFCSLLLLKQVFGVVMGGVGIIALAGIIVNNNILLIDSFESKLKLYCVKEAIIRACISRIRPILLTVATTSLGLLPMITKISINFFKREITYNAPASQWWTHLSITIASGLILATALTLFFTPALLYCKKYKGKDIDNK